MKWMREEERKFFGEHGYLIESVAEYTRHGNVFREEEHWFIPQHDPEKPNNLDNFGEFCYQNLALYVPKIRLRGVEYALKTAEEIRECYFAKDENIRFSGYMVFKNEARRKVYEVWLGDFVYWLEQVQKAWDETGSWPPFPATSDYDYLPVWDMHLHFDGFDLFPGD